MNRANYTDDLDESRLNLWRGAVTRAINGKRGQAFLQELAAALDALPEPKLIANELEHPLGGQWCSLGAVGRARGLNMQDPNGLDPEDPEGVAKAMGIAPAMAREIMYENDEDFDHYAAGAEGADKRDRARWARMRDWVRSHLKEESPS